MHALQIVWLQIAFGYRLNLVADCIWLQIAFGCILHLVISEVHCTVIFQFSGAVSSFDEVEEGQKGMGLHDIFI